MHKVEFRTAGGISIPNNINKIPKKKDLNIIVTQIIAGKPESHPLYKIRRSNARNC
jgi:hypothetical protein